MEFFAEFWNYFSMLVEQGKQSSHFLLPIYLTMIFSERLLYLFDKSTYNAKDAFSSAGVIALNSIFGVLIGGIVQFYLFIWLSENAALFHLPYTWWGWLAGFLIHDLIYCTDHRIAHKTGLFWAFHHVHHSAKEFNFTTAGRGFFLDGVLTQPLYYLMPIVGMDIFQIVVIVTFTNLFGIFNHTRTIKNLGPLEYILATPSNHRVHHGSDVKYLDKNYGQVLILWDILFGSFKREEEEPTYGLTENINTYNPLIIEIEGLKWLSRQMKSAPSWRDKLRYLYMPPGWSHTGDHKTVEQLMILEGQKNVVNRISV